MTSIKSERGGYDLAILLFILVICLNFILTSVARAQNDAAPSEEEKTQTDESAKKFKKLSLKELMDLEVTSISRRPEKLSESASAIQVITQEDIRRSGATSIPEVLRLASNLEVFQINSMSWAISARGSASSISNKLLVLIDGRTIYSPLFAGVFWEVQDTLLEFIDRIEVISGPGATSWGANAVNGVINIITKNATETQGLMLIGAGGNELLDRAGVRYGGTLGANTTYRIYGKHIERDSTVTAQGKDAENDWRMVQGGFRFDWKKSETDLITLLGDHYDNLARGNETATNGSNLIFRWSRNTSENSGYDLQFYFDRANRRVIPSFDDALNTYDVDFQHRVSPKNQHNIVWGGGYRLIDDNIENSANFAFLPADFSLHTVSAFVQDEIELLKDEVSLLVGTKLEHNGYTGFEIQPSGRVAWRIDQEQTLWGAISRAVRTPSRLDRDFFVPAEPPFVLAGGPNFESEVLLAYELGYRVHPYERIFLSIATFYHDYDKIRSLEQVNPPFPFPVVIENNLEGESYGAELTMDYRMTDRVRIWAGYTELRVHLRSKPGSTDTSFGATEANDPDRQFFLRSSLDLPHHLEFDSMFRYIGEFETVSLPGYAQMDLRFGWSPNPNLEISIVGQNLLHDRQIEFGTPNTGQGIERSVYGKIVWRY